MKPFWHYPPTPAKHHQTHTTPWTQVLHSDKRWQKSDSLAGVAILSMQLIFHSSPSGSKGCSSFSARIASIWSSCELSLYLYLASTRLNKVIQGGTSQYQVLFLLSWGAESPPWGQVVLHFPCFPHLVPEAPNREFLPLSTVQQQSSVSQPFYTSLEVRKDQYQQTMYAYCNTQCNH